MILRSATAVSSSFVVTFFLLFAMNALISLKPAVVAERGDKRPFWFTRVPPPEPPPANVFDAPDRTIVEPVQPPATRAPGNHELAAGIGVPASIPQPVARYSGPEGLGVNGPLVSLVRPQPAYPAAALRQGIEGWVIVEFDVREDGRVANVVVVKSSDPVFENAAVKATLKFRYKPLVIDGAAQTSPGIRNIIRFEIKD